MASPAGYQSRPGAPAGLDIQILSPEEAGTSEASANDALEAQLLNTARYYTIATWDW